MVESHGPEDLLNVPVEATAFLAAVSAFAVFLLVIFVYVNKKWRFLNVGTGTQPKQPPLSTKSQSQYRTQIGEYEILNAPETSSDSEEDVLRRLRLQQQLSHQQHSQHSFHHHHGGLTGSLDGGRASTAVLMRQSSFDHDMEEPLHSHHPYSQHQHHPLHRQESTASPLSLHHNQHPQQQQHQHHHPHQQHYSSNVTSSSSHGHKSIDLVSSSSYSTPSQQHPSHIANPQSSVSSTIVPSNLSNLSSVVSALTSSPYSTRSETDAGHSSFHSHNSGAMSSQSTSLMNSPVPGPSSSQMAHSSQSSQGIRPLRVSSIRDVDDMCSRRRPHPKGLIRSNTGPGRSSSGGNDGNDLISLAEKGKVNGGSSASSTSSNASADDDLHHHHNHHAHHSSHHSHSNHHQSTLSHPHPITVRHSTLSRDRDRDPIQRIQQPGTSGSTGSTSNSNYRRIMTMPPRTKSVDSESPPPSEPGLSTYGDSIADQDDHIFEVEEMSLVEGELGLTLEAGRVPSSPIQCGSLEIAFDYEAAARKLTAHIIQARGVPPKDIGGASNTQVRIVLLPGRKQKHKTKVRPGENPSFMESFVFNKINPEEVSSLGIRFRLYGCERMRRERLLGECVLGFGSVHLELENTLWLNLEPRYHLKWDTRSETGSLARSDSASSTASIQNGIPELLVGLAYNGTTGRLTVEVIKGSHFRNLAGGRAPDSYIKLVLVSCSGQEMGRAKTSLRRAQSNPLFKETFMFQVALFQISEVTLLVSVYGRKGVTRRELLGWFALGYNSSGEEETTHWEDMGDAQGDQMCRWHVLLQS